MSVKFTLERRTNKFGECPIRLSWSFGGLRYQTTLGYSIKKANWDEMRKLVKARTHNYKGQTADDINFYIKRIGLVAMGIERHYVGNEKALTKGRMKQAVSDILSNTIARTDDVIERCIEGIEPHDQSATGYYRDQLYRYYKFLCDAQYHHITFYILQQLFGKGERIAAPSTSCKSMKEVKDEKRSKTDYDYEEVPYEKVYGRQTLRLVYR